MEGDFAAASRYRRTVLRSRLSSRAMRRRDQPCAANCSILFCSFTLRTFAIVPAVMPSREHSAEIYRRLKVGNLESVKRDHFRPEAVPFQRPLTPIKTRNLPFERCSTCLYGHRGKSQHSPKKQNEFFRCHTSNASAASVSTSAGDSEA